MDSSSKKQRGKNKKMVLRQLSKNIKIPIKVLRQMMEDGAVTEKLDDADQEFLYRLLAIIRKRYFIRHCILQIKSTERENFVSNAHLETKWERYIYTHMVNHYAFRGKLKIQDFVDQAEKVFQFKLTKEHVKKIEKIRNSIYQRQSRHNKKSRLAPP